MNLDKELQYLVVVNGPKQTGKTTIIGRIKTLFKKKVSFLKSEEDTQLYISDIKAILEKGESIVIEAGFTNQTTMDIYRKLAFETGVMFVTYETNGASKLVSKETLNKLGNFIKESYAE